MTNTTTVNNWYETILHDTDEMFDYYTNDKDENIECMWLFNRNNVNDEEIHLIYKWLNENFKDDNSYQIIGHVINFFSDVSIYNIKVTGIAIFNEELACLFKIKWC